MINVFISDIVLLSTKRGLLELDVNVEKDLGRKLDIESVTFNTGVAFDSREDRVYFIKYSNGDIMSVFRNGSGKKCTHTNTHTHTHTNSGRHLHGY